MSTRELMSGPRHYVEAEWLLAWVDEVQTNLHEWDEVTEGELHQALATAQVHAILALAAATAYPASRVDSGDEDTPRDRAVLVS